MDIQGFLPARQNVADHFRRGQSVLARVLGSPESGVYQLSIRNQVFQVRSDQPLRSGQYLRLQVLGPQGFALVGSPAADGAATPSPPATTTLGREAALLTMFGLPLLPEFI